MGTAALVCRGRLDPIMVVCAILAVGCGLWADCYHQNLFEAQPCVTALAVVIQRPDLCDDFRGVGECFPSEAADPPSLSLE